MARKEPPKSFARRDRLLKIEEAVQKQWEEAAVFETDAPLDEEERKQPKYFCTFPYPYMNGALHLGHAFTITKAEFASRYQRLKGKKVLFPFGFHCTGMPIPACADKLRREIETYGNPPQFPGEEEKEAKEEKEVVPAVQTGGKKKRKKKGKIAGKKSAQKFQWEIMKDMGVPESEIPLFCDSKHWLDVFPPLAMKHLQRFGLGTDWRRSFITTDVNPFYDAFVRWHFFTLRKRGKIEFGKRHVVFSPKDNQPCADHDRSSGEGVGPQEYTAIKMKLVDIPEVLKSFASEERQIFLPAATLRPETMYGQTNCWVLPSGEYGIFEMKDGNIFVASQRSVLNMAFQDLTAEHAVVKQLGTVKGQDLLGLRVAAPLSKYPFVYTLPLLTIKMDKGTGVVTSVPSDSPDDYAALKDMKEKAQLRKKYGITEEMVMPFEVVPIIQTETLGDRCAQFLCESSKVKSQHDKQLPDLKEKAYAEGFYKGKMIVGVYDGRTVQEAKPLVKAMLVQQGDAVVYHEPESVVMSRSGNECVVTAADQWYLLYGEEKWRRETEAHVDSTLETFNATAHKKFKYTLGWLKEWACSRTYGLGTKLPWDPKWIIESLSDSTVYMSYYTIAHLLEKGKFGITAEQLTPEVFDYVFALAEEAPETSIAKEVLEKMKSEFTYWYPLDLRVSGKDLITNHLTMSLYNHSAVWENRPAMWPRSFYTNGHLMINSKKMSKSTGVFLTLEQAMFQYSTDATRLALANAGDYLFDANFAEDIANKAILRLTKELDWMKEIMEQPEVLVEGNERSSRDAFFDQIFENEMNRCVHTADHFYSRMLFGKALQSCFFGLANARDFYRSYVTNGMRGDLVRKWMKTFAVVTSPVVPHVAEHMWKMLGEEGFIVNAKWPEAGAVNDMLTRQVQYLTNNAHNFRQELKTVTSKARKKKNAPVLNAAHVYVAKEFPEWRLKVLDVLRHHVDEKVEEEDEEEDEVKLKLPDMKQLSRELAKDPMFQGKANKKMLSKALQFASWVKANAATAGATALETTLPFNEAALLNEHFPFIVKDVGLTHIRILPTDSQEAKVPAAKLQAAVPGTPCFFFFHADE